MAGFKARAGAEADIAYHLEQSPTLLAGNNDATVLVAPVGYSQAAYDKFITDEKSATLKARGGTYGGGSETLIVEEVKGFPLGFRAENTRLYDETATTLCNGTRPGWCNGVIHNEEQEAVVRRLTPLECERLQGFPDLWTDIPEYVDSKGKAKTPPESARYKALGNSIAIPPWFYVLQKLNLCCGADHTMASLFDGIGGFPLIWEMLNGEGSCIWASEIEDFPIAVTKVRFPEE